MRTAVVGHVEWIHFVRVERVPLAGEIVHPSEAWEEPGGGGGVAVVQLAKLAGEATLFTALGDDGYGRWAHAELTRHGVRVEAAFRSEPQRRAFCFIDVRGERTITTIGNRLGPHRSDPLPWAELGDVDAVYFTAGDPGALQAARAARVLVATTRERAALSRGGVALDAVVGSGRDPSERYVPFEPAPRLVVATAGIGGGTYRTADGRSGSYPAAPLPGPVSDTYGCGDSFAAGLTYALGAGYEIDEALGVAARCGAACATGRGPFEGQLTRAEPRPSASPPPETPP